MAKHDIHDIGRLIGKIKFIGEGELAILKYKSGHIDSEGYL